MTKIIKSNKKISLLLATAIIGSLSIVALAPAAFAFGPNSAQGGNQGQNKFNQMHQNSHMQMQRGGQRGDFRSKTGLLKLACSSEGAKKLEVMLGKVSDKFDLSSEQQGLFDKFEKSALIAQTNFADSCPTLKADGANKSEGNIITRLNDKRQNFSAIVIALDEVLPELEAFYDSLSDEQKAAMKKQGRGMQGSGMKGMFNRAN
jgi:hypothetical protein